MAIYNGSLISANQSDKNKNYFCPICKSLVILKRGNKKISHFAHSKDSDCINIGENETNEHLNGKLSLFKFINNRNTKIEYFIDAIKQRPDLFNDKIAFEFQCSPITEKRLMERINGYRSIGIHSLWILGSNYRKKFSSHSTTKFFYYFVNIGFYIMFLHSNRSVEIRYNCLEVNGKICYQSKIVYSFNELLLFLKSKHNLLKYNNDKKQLNNLSRKLRQNIILGNKLITKSQNNCYTKGHNIDGSPLICNKRYYSYPIFNKKYFLWKVICVNMIEDGIYLDYLYKSSLRFVNIKYQFPLIKNIDIFYKYEFQAFIQILSNENLIQIKNNKIYLLKQLSWFKDYLFREKAQNEKDYQ